MTSALGQTYRLSRSIRPAPDTNPAPDSGIEWVFESVPSFSATIPVASPEPVSDRTGAGGSASSPRLRLLAWHGTSEAPDAEFVLRGELGAGGMGTVYEARQTSLGRSVALKMLRPEYALEPAAVTAFLHEAAVTGDLDHPNIVPVYELGTAELAGGQPFYAMKRVVGTPWSDVIDGKTTVDNVEILLRVCDAIAFAHSRDVIHRDLKPDNVMLGDFGEVLVMDWGLSVSTLPAGRAMPLTESNIGGTPAYMAPELAGTDLSAIGPASDVYLLGAMLYRVVAGHPPHTGADLRECVANARRNVIVPTDATGELVDIARACMATHPADRPGSVKDLQERLRDHLLHAQASALIDRAREVLEEARRTGEYYRFSLALFTYAEALRLWPGSPAATRGLDEGRRAYSAVAMDRGDLDLAASLAPVGSVQAVAVEELRKRRACGEAMREELEKSAEKWGIAFLSSPDSVVLVQVPEGIVLEANQKFEILTGWARQEVVGRTTMEIALWANEDDRQSTLRLALENGFYDNFETTFRRKDGTLFPVLLSCRLLDINGRKVAVANARDITELHTQRAELRRANDRLARAQALAGLGIWELDTATRGLWWSEETFKLAGMPPGDGTPDFDVYLQTVVEADRALLLRALAEAELHGNAFQVRIRHHRPDGTLNHVVARGEPVLDDGRVVQVLGSVMAIPEPK